MILTFLFFWELADLGLQVVVHRSIAGFETGHFVILGAALSCATRLLVMPGFDAKLPENDSRNCARLPVRESSNLKLQRDIRAMSSRAGTQ